MFNALASWESPSRRGRFEESLSDIAAENRRYAINLRVLLGARSATNALTSDVISVMYSLMETTVTELLREFPRVRRAALAGETVIIKSREGNLRLSLDAPATGSLIGCMRGLLAGADDDIDGPTSDAGSWDSDL